MWSQILPPGNIKESMGERMDGLSWIPRLEKTWVHSLLRGHTSVTLPPNKFYFLKGHSISQQYHSEV